MLKTNFNTRHFFTVNIEVFPNEVSFRKEHNDIYLKIAKVYFQLANSY